MTRRTAYISTRSFFFKEAIIAGAPRRAAWASAKAKAAVYTFQASTEFLKVWVPVW